MKQAPKIVILGAGYAGIVAAIRLQKELQYNEADVTLVNKHDYHYITTHLHMPAAGTDHPENARVSIPELVDTNKIRFIKSTVTRIHTDSQTVELEDGTLSYDYLVVGLGGEPETFGITGLKEHAFNIRSINSVRLIKTHIDNQFASYKQYPNQTEYLTVVVGGAGFTGIEFVGELADRLPVLCETYDVDPKKVRIVNVEAAPTVLPGFDPALVEYAMKVLKDKGVEFKIGCAVKECTEDKIVLATGEEIKARTVIWTGGIRGNRLIEESGFEAMRGRVKVNEMLQAPGKENVFILGDCSIFINPDGKPYPPTAQIAMQEGEAVAYNLLAALRGQTMKPFRPSIKGTVASLGKNEAIGVVFKFKMKGWIASFMKKVIDARYLFIIGGFPLVLRKAIFKAR
jgi:NADH dehydrogenase